ncbi:MAG: CvpA family protein [Pseudomonadota bacterium]
MTAFDYAVLGMVGVSVAYSVWRGVVREVMALLGWVVAFWVAGSFAHVLEPLMPAWLASASLPALRMLVAYAVLFGVVLLLAGSVAWAASRLVKSTGLGATDRILGGVFGVVRGMAIVMVLVLAAGLTALPKSPMWRNAALSAPLEEFAVYLKTWLPKELAGRIHYE